MQKPKQIPTKSGVYIFRDAKQKPLYIGKAGNLKKRLVSYWLKNAPSKTQRLVREATSLAWRETDSEIGALILEARLIKQHLPKYNVLMRDDKNYFYVGFTKEEFPRMFITHQPHQKSQISNLKSQKHKLKIRNFYIGPYTGGTALKTTLRLLRRIFPYCTCKTVHKRQCLNAEIGRCLGYCCVITNNPFTHPNFSEEKLGRARPTTDNQHEYQKNIKNIIAVLRGKKQKLLVELKKRMREKSRKQEYEQAALLRNQIAGLEDIFAHKSVLELPRAKTNWPALEQRLRLMLGAKNKIHRIEGYDISNISGKDATGSMVVFTGGKPDKKEYLTFRIKTIAGANDPAMIGEIIARRLNHREWQYPDIMVIDGGRAQLTTAQAVVTNKHESATTNRHESTLTNHTNDSDRIRDIRGSFVPIRVVALAKREEELYTEKGKAPIPLKTIDRDILHLFQAVRDEAHRFAKKYHQTLRRSSFKK